MAGTPAAEVTVTPDLVRALLADQHPQFAQLPVNFSGEGWDNFMFRLGDDLAVRLPRRNAAVDLLLNEQRCLSRLAPLPLPIPAPIAIGQPGRGFPWTWSVIPWIDGAPVDHAPLDAHQGPVLAGFLRALHTPAPLDAPVNLFRGIPLETRRERIDACLDRVRASSDLVTSAIDRAWRAALAAPEWSAPPVWLHGDIHAQNVLSKDGRLAGLIDWGDMCSGDPAVDLCAVWGILPHASARAAALAAYAPDDALLARARGWALLFGATLFDNGRVDDPRHAAIGEATLRRLNDDLQGNRQ
jgi:aminoglycoside phosphotransferase (APT) family kinase protein